MTTWKGNFSYANDRVLPTIHVHLFIILSICLGTAVSAQPTHSAQQKPRHIIVAYDTSTSMRGLRGTRISAAQLQEVNETVLDMLYRSLSSSARSGDRLDRDLVNKELIDFNSPLYRRGDILTYYTFDIRPSFDRGYRRKRVHIPRLEFSERLPQSGGDLKGERSLLAYAEVTAYENTEPGEEQEILWIRVSDRQIDPSPDNELVGDVYDKQRKWQGIYHLEPVYSVRKFKWVWIDVYRMALFHPRPPEGIGGAPFPFELVNRADPARPLKELRFKVARHDRRALVAGEYALIPNQDLEFRSVITKVRCSIKHREGDNPVHERELYDGAPIKSLSLESLRIPVDYVNPDYRMSLEISYNLDLPKGKARTREFKIQEITMVPAVAGDFGLSKDSTLYQPVKTVNLERGRRHGAEALVSQRMWLMEKSGASPRECRIRKVELYLGRRKCQDCVSRDDSSGGGGVPLSQRVQLVIPDKIGTLMPPCKPVESRLCVFFDDGFSKTSKMREIPLSLVKVLADPVADEVQVRPAGTPKLRGLDFTWENDLLGLKGHYLTVPEESSLRHCLIKDLVIRFGPELSWSSGSFSASDLPRELPVRLDAKRAQELMELRPENAAVEITYLSPCSNQPKQLSLTVPVTIESPPCPTRPFIVVEEKRGGKPLRELTLQRDEQNNLILSGLEILRNPGARAPAIVDEIKQVTMELANSSISWSPPAGEKLPERLQPKVLDVKETVGLYDGEYDAEFVIDFVCVSGQEGPMERKMIQQVRVRIPPATEPKLLVVDKTGAPPGDISSRILFGKCSIAGLQIKEPTGGYFEAIGVKIVRMEVGSRAGGKPWRSWDTAGGIPEEIAFEINDTDKLPRNRDGKVEGQLAVYYEQPGRKGPGKIVQDFNLVLKDMTGPLLILLTLVLTGLAAALGYMLWPRHRVDFTLLIYEGTGKTETGVFRLSGGQSLFLSGEDEPNCPDLDCPGFSIENRKGDLFLVKPDSDGEEIRPGAKYQVRTDLDKVIEIEVREFIGSREGEMEEDKTEEEMKEMEDFGVTSGDDGSTGDDEWGGGGTGRRKRSEW